MKNINILIADDEVDSCHFIQKTLLRQGFNVDTVFNGKDAVERMKANKYDFAFLDFYMPELTGVEVVKIVKENGLKCVIVMITGHPEMDEFFAKTLGVDEYLEKPFTLDNVKAIISKYSKIKKGKKKNEGKKANRLRVKASL